MRRLLKTFFIACLAAAAVLFPSSGANAATYTPNNVTKLTAVSKTETTVQLRWTEVYNATGYYLYMTDISTGQKKKIATTKNAYYKVKNLSLGKKYRFQVYSYQVKYGKTYKSAKASPSVTVKTKRSTPGPINNLRVSGYGDQEVNLKWDTASGATGYLIYKYDSASKTYVRLAKTSNTFYRVKNLSAGTKYYFKVCSYHTYNGTTTYGDLSSKVSFKAKSVDLSTVHGRYFYATLNKTTTVTTSKGKRKTLKKGAKVTVTNTTANKATILINSKTTATINRSLLTYQNLNSVKTYYTKAQAEAFVNSKNYTSPTDYLIWVSQYTLATYVFKGSCREWSLVYKMPCVVGKNGNTPVNTYHIVKKAQRYGDVMLYIAWFPGIQSGYGFHARVNSTSRAAASGGCIRLGSSDLHWLDSHCAIGTTVISY